MKPDLNDATRLIHVFDSEINYEEKPSNGRQRLLIEQARTIYRPDDLGAAQNDPLTLLTLGTVEPLALPGESYKLAFTPGLLAQVYQRPHDEVQPPGPPPPENLLPNPVNVLDRQGADRGGYRLSQDLKATGAFPNTDLDGHWWIPSGRVFLSPTSDDSAAKELDFARLHFFLPHRYRDPFHTNAVSTESFVTYDTYDLLMLETRDPLGNVVTVTTQDDDGNSAIRIDYRVLQAYWVTDPNRNRTQVAFDALGMVVATAVMGKPGENKGDNMVHFEADLTQTQIDTFHGALDPHALAATLLKGASTCIVYDLHRFRLSQQAHPEDSTQWEPPYAATLARETHASDPLPPQGLKIQISFSYSDGFGREIQKKMQAEPGSVPQRDANGKIIVGADGQPVMTANDVSPRWVGSGWTVFNNKGKPTHQASMEAGERWMLNDVAGKPILAWDSRGFLRSITYDALRRPTETFVTENGVERLDARTVYGEGQGAANNHRTRVFQVFDGAGVVTSEAYDFKGNLLRSRRDLLPNYQQAVNWQQNPVPNDGTFTSSTTYDALNRPTTVTAPDNSIYRPTYNEANLLDKVEVNLRGAAAPTPFVTNINYDAKGRRELIAYGNGAQTRYEYDRLTFRLTTLQTTHPVGLNGLASQLFTDPAVVQDLRYTYDPVGNITRIADAALQTIVHNNQPVQPVCGYTYDALYRLIKAQGREHIGQTAHDFNPPDGNRRDFDFAGLADFIAHPNDMQAMRNYTEEYAYDAVGNFQFMHHRANGGSWTRNYEYKAPSLLETTKQSNRLMKTTVGNGSNFVETYTYTDAQGNDVDGCITAINSLKMVWNSQDQLQQVDLGGGGTAYYVYDGGGQRARKVIETQNGTRKQERIYLGGFEVYREYDGGGTSVTLERETLHVMDDKQRIALVETKTIDNQSPIPTPQPLIRYQIGNHLGSASLELDDAGQIISYEEYTPYGSTSYQAGRSAVEVSLKRYRN